MSQYKRSTKCVNIREALNVSKYKRSIRCVNIGDILLVQLKELNKLNAYLQQTMVDAITVRFTGYILLLQQSWLVP